MGRSFWSHSYFDEYVTGAAVSAHASYQAGDFGAKLDSFERWSRGIQSAVDTAAVALGGVANFRGVTHGVTSAFRNGGFTGVGGKIAQNYGRMLRGQNPVCFVAGTQVVVGIAADGSYITKNIEDLQEGDLVLARDQYDEGGGVELREVVRLFRKTSDHLRVVRIQDSDGNIETIRTTDEHPFWVAAADGAAGGGGGWVAAKDLRPGDRLNEADDSNNAVVLSSIREEHPDGVAVYNFEVAGDHTYFIEDGYGAQTAVWVHNRCNAELRANLGLAKGDPRKAAHVVPVGAFTHRAADVRKSIASAQRILARNKIGINTWYNGFATKSSRHMGTHTDAFLGQLGRRLFDAEKLSGRAGVLNELNNLKWEVLADLY